MFITKSRSRMYVNTVTMKFDDDDAAVRTVVFE